MKKFLALVLTVVMAASLAACGNSGTKETQAPASTEAASETAAASETTGETEASDAASGDLTHVNVAYMANYASLWQVATAINKGYFKDEGLDVQLYMFQDGPTEIASMESGSIDVAYIGPGAHKLCIKGQADIFCFSQLGNADCVMGLKSHGVNSLEDLKGKKVAYASGTSSETILKRALNSVGLTMDDIEAYDMEVSNMVSAIVSGSIDACAPWSPSSTTIANELGDDVQTFCTNTTFSDIAADCASWICMPKYAEENRDVLVRFTRALFKAMDYAAADHQEDTAALIAKQIAGDQDTVYDQRGDAEWLTGKEVSEGAADGTVEGYYELQKENFIEAGAVEVDPPVSDYVLLDVMKEAGEY